MDDANANFEKTLGELREAYGPKVLPLSLPIMQNEKMIGIVDVLSAKAYSCLLYTSRCV